MSATVRRAGAAFGLALSAWCARAEAGSFQLYEGDTDWMANAYAGQASKAYDAGTAWANPAGMVRIPGIAVDTSFNWVEPRFRFTGGNTLFPDAGAAGAASVGVPAIHGAALPASFSVVDLGAGLAAGFAVKSPFGARIAYAPNWVGRYQSATSSLTTISFEPSAAYAVTPRLSVGLGPVFDYMTVRETQDVRPAVGYRYGDIYADVNGTNWAFGYNVGALYQLDPATRFGVSYRSRIVHDVPIRQTLAPSPALVASPVFPLVAQALKTQVTPGLGYAKGSEQFNLPDSLDLSAYHDLSPEWSVMADAIWTHWQIFQSIVIRTEGTGNKPIVNQFGFHDTWFGSLGATYRPRLLAGTALQIGAGFDGDPVNDASRQAQIPTEDRVLLDGGITYDIDKHFSLDIAYSHFFCLPARIDNTGPTLANALQLSAGRLIGRYDNAIDSFSGGLKVRF